MSSCSRGTSHASLRRCAGGRRGWGQSRGHGGGRSLDEDPLFCFVCVLFLNRRWNLTDGLYRGGERNGPMATEIESVTGVERSDGRDFQRDFYTSHHRPITSQ
jgi:hypothetical protein